MPFSLFLCIFVFVFVSYVPISVSPLLIFVSFSLFLCPIFWFVFVFVSYVPISVSCLVSGAAAVGSALPRFNPPAGGLRL